MPIYVRLFQGRKTPSELITALGESGPVFGPYDCYYHITYVDLIRMLRKSDEDPHDIRIIGGLLYYDGSYYGDWAVISEDSIQEGGLDKCVAPFEEAKAQLPGQPVPTADQTEEESCATSPTQRVRCPGCGLPVEMPADWDGSAPEEALCNTCHDNDEKADRAAAALAAYRKAHSDYGHGSNEPLAQMIVDLLTDLRHWCDPREIDLDDAVRFSEIHFEEER